VLENYFVNYVFKTLFPLGPQKCSYKKRLYMHPKSIFEEYMLLVIQYAMMKSLLVGMAGYWGEGFGTNHALKLIQSFAKNVDHDISYQQRILQFFWENDMMNLACAETLIGN
jgi:lysine-N-methylase